MPVAFMYSGIVLGIFVTIFTAFICTHCSYILVKCAHTLYKRTHKTAMTFSEVAEVAFSNGPRWGRPFAKFSKILILQSLFWTYFGTCSVYTVIVATNFQQIAVHYTGNEISLRVVIVALLIPLILLSWIPNLKYLAPVSMLANAFVSVYNARHFNVKHYCIDCIDCRWLSVWVLHSTIWFRICQMCLSGRWLRQ